MAVNVVIVLLVIVSAVGMVFIVKEAWMAILRLIPSRQLMTTSDQEQLKPYHCWYQPDSTSDLREIDIKITLIRHFWIKTDVVAFVLHLSSLCNHGQV